MTMNLTKSPETFVALVCAECGTGNYSRSILTGKVRCEHCDHHIYSGDIDLDPGESLAWSGPLGVLGYVTAE